MHQNARLFRPRSASTFAQSCPTLWDPLGFNPPGSSVHGISQVRILEQVVTSYSRESFWSSDWTWVSCVFCFPRGVFTHSAIREALTKKLVSSITKYNGRLPWWPSGKETACHRKGHGFDPCFGKIPHGTKQLSTEHHNYSACAQELQILKLAYPRARAL